ncbi:ABC transporter ATP-binding protein [Leptospira kanakyensis]|uniref:ABC transporter ATP-binding protein n=1 Tax=Leptospira kanakyensis TaxID=2484968 RepID=A0A6N4QNP2_9LEPT|nr:ABC transporter ATP-binding protein [Leptospira kanakyensis]MCW7468237.1 ABC transporter ATP-binding protein [Leptospira kanakyensis]MCW7482616.1 ABC transporter ATP-binding protein [Leptospira kanakyensis]TGK55318.1 ABC transporter ATP-binding protein [Leptospira kanakyensis]TGK60852.1 ABC transporter ATP-binding protein [Leptospira kanakyensis]TGK76673.1 ABC transporter ATP-binding protein [Leptospira kanakyensis]
MLGIEAKHIFKSFGEPPQDILKDVSLEIGLGDFVALTGKSGSGKSTLLYIVSGLDNPSSGDVKLNGSSLIGMESKEIHRLRNLSIGFVFQFHYLLPELTGLENITMPGRKTGTHKTMEDYALHLMESFSVLHCKDKFPSQMSGGEGQRVAIARALVQKPKFLFADEPTGNLDTINGDKVMEIFKRVNKEDGTTILFVTHDPDYASLANRRVHMIDGKIAEIS